MISPDDYAFPLYGQQMGMVKREFIAALICSGAKEQADFGGAVRIARNAVALADALLVELAK